MEVEPERVTARSRVAPPPQGRVELRQVSYSYAPGAPPTVRDVSLEIQPGQKVALVGRTGSGKSTLAMLLLGLYTPTHGEILFDGVPQQALDLRAMRRRYGVVLQEPFLFAGSIRQNITFNIPDLPLESVVRAARRAAIHDDIARLPMGYETLVGEGGSGLSGGQRQRLVLARALVHEPTVVLLDEATSALDAATEWQIERNLRDLACTRIVIAHRLSTVRDADTIVVLDEGAIVEQGTHEALLEADGYYAALARHQGTGPAT
jgi:ABC-type bacteriocin/lantibiotic exporter with double-glycine peptidase domain